MFKQFEINKIIGALEEYLTMNNVIYNYPDIVSKLNEVEDKYKELNIKCCTGINGYEQYTDEYVFMMKCQKLDELFSMYPALNDWNLGLWQILNKNKKHQQIYTEANMSLGSEQGLTSEEILTNEICCKKRIDDIKVHVEIDKLYKRR